MQGSEIHPRDNQTKIKDIRKKKPSPYEHKISIQHDQSLQELDYCTCTYRKGYAKMKLIHIPL